MNSSDRDRSEEPSPGVGGQVRPRKSVAPTRSPGQPEQPPSYTDTFIRPCLLCGKTVHTVGGVEQEHAHHAVESDQESIAYAWWQGHDAATPAVSVSGATREATEAQVQAAAESMACEASGPVCRSLTHHTGTLTPRGCGHAVRIADAVVAAGPVDAELAAVVAERDLLRRRVKAGRQSREALAAELRLAQDRNESLAQSDVGTVWSDMNEAVNEANARADRAEATLAKVAEVLRKNARCGERYIENGSGDPVCSGHGWFWADGRTFCNGVDDGWVDLAAILDADPAPEPQADSKPGQNLEVEGEPGVEEPCPDCGLDSADVHVEGCRRIFTRGDPREDLQFGPPWKPWREAPTEATQTGGEVR